MTKYARLAIRILAGLGLLVGWGFSTALGEDGDSGARMRLREAVEGLAAADEGAGVAGAELALGDAEPLVRARAVEYLGVGPTSAAARTRRIELLRGSLLGDPSELVRRAAAKALGGIDDPRASEALGSGLRALPAPDHDYVADALDDLRSSAEAIRAAVVEALADPGRAPQGAGLAELVEAYGQRLPDAPGGGLEVSERAPLLAARRHPDERVRNAAASGLTGALDRLVWLDAPERARALLAGFSADGWDPADLDYRAAVLSLALARDPEDARRHADRLVARRLGETTAQGRTFRAYGHLLQASAEIAQRSAEPAREALGRARASLEAAVAARGERRAPRGSTGHAEAARAVDRLQLLALVDVLWITAGRMEGRAVDDADLVAAARRVHVRALEAELLEIRSDALVGTASLDVILDRDLAPRRLICSGGRLPAWSQIELLGLLEDLARTLALVAPEELLGFRAAESEFAIQAPLEDEERLELLKSMRIAQIDYASQKLSDPDERSNRRIWTAVRQRLGEDLSGGDEAAGWRPLLDYRDPSLLALDLAAQWRAEGDSERSLALLEDLALDVDAVERPPSANWKDWTQARLSLALGSALSDLGRPEDSAAELLSAQGRLEALENGLVASREELIRGRQGVFQIETGDPRARAQIEAQILGTQRLRADVLVSLAVNANVRLGDSELALGYFERALELQQSEFMTVLAACYRARAGRDEEARFLLESVQPAPGLYYNLACTYALLGETEAALVYLEQELEDPSRSPGAVARQREWAAEDPDLASLLGVPEFERLTAGE